MKDIKDCCLINYAAPINTIGASNVSLTNGDNLIVKNKKKKSKMKSLNQFISEKKKCIPNGFCILKPEFVDNAEEWLTYLKNNNWNIINKKTLTMDKSIAQELYKDYKDEDFYDDLCNYMSSSDSLCCTCYKDCVDPIDDMNKLKDKIRKKWARDKMKNAMHSSDSINNVNREIKIIFG